VEKRPEQVELEKDKKAKDRAETEATIQKQQNQIIQFGKLEHPIFLGSDKKGNLKTTALGMDPLPGITSNQWRIIQKMRA
jgi:hypothetical protein